MTIPDAPDLADQAQLIEDVLDASGLEWDAVGERRWTTMLAGEWKRTIPLLLELGDRSLALTSLLCGVPDEGHADVYRLVLHKNEDLEFVHFALDDAGDVILAGHLPRAALTESLLGQALGQVLAVSDETFNAVLRAGFGTYIEAEQAWRAKNGMPPNPVSEG